MPSRPEEDPVERVRVAYRAARRGALEDALRLAPLVEGDGLTSAFWPLALRLAAGEEPPPELRPEPVPTDAADVEAWIAVCESMERRSARGCDVAALGAWIDSHAACLPAVDDPALRLARCQYELLSASDGCADLAAALAADADRSGLAHVGLEARSVEALAALREGDLARATDRARRAARMARAEGASELLTNLVLARVRRAHGAPYLTLRIASALAAVAPAGWRPWIAYEIAMAGEPERALATLGGARGAPLADAVATLVELLASAREGDRDTFDRASEGLARELAGCPWLGREVSELVSALDPTAPLDAIGGDLYAFCSGATSEPPPSIRGFLHGPAHASYVVKIPRRPARRVLAAGLPLLGDPELAVEGRSSPTRQDTALAVLTLAGREGLSDAEFFEATYGFGYKARVHRGQLDVLKHRLRAGLSEPLVLRRVGDRNVLAGAAQLVVLDPRCARPAADGVLRALSGGRATAREVAERLGVSLRTAQGILRELVEEGTCIVHKEGRAVRYAVEDTSFSEPTTF